MPSLPVHPLAPSRRLALATALLLAALVPCAARAGAPGVRFEIDSRGGRTLVIEPGPVLWRSTGTSFVAEIDGFGRLGVASAPDLPARRERVAIDPGTELVLDGVDVEWSEGRLPGALDAFPSADPARAPIDDAIASGGWWPQETARVVVPEASFRTLRFGEVLVAPVQVDLAAGAFRVARRITLRFREAGSTRAAAAAPALSSSRPDPLVESLAGSLAHGAASVGRAPSVAPQALAATPAAPAAAPAFPAWQFDVAKDGLYRITYEWAQANAPALLAFLVGHAPAQYHLSAQGVDVPLQVSVANGTTFGPGDSIMFYGQGDASAALFQPAPGTWQGGQLAPANVYRLDLQSNPLRIAADPGTRAPQSGYTVPASFRATVHHEEDTQFLGFMEQDGLDHWFAAPFLSSGCIATTSCTGANHYALPDARCGGCGSGNTCCGTTLDQVVDTPGHAGGAIAYRVGLHGFNYANNLHRTEVLVDHATADTSDWAGFVEFTLGVDGGARTYTPATPLAAQTVFTVRTPLGRSGVTQDTEGLNWVEVDYDRLYQAAGDALAFTAPNDAGHEVHVAGLADAVDVWEISDTVTSPAGGPIAQPRRVTGWTAAGGTLRFEYDVRAGAGTRSFIAAGPSGTLVPATIRQDLPPSSTDAALGSTLTGPGLGADWIVIGERSLLDTSAGSRLSALVARRRAQGLSTAVIDVRDIYDEFSDGIEHPQAIRDFIAWTLAHWSPAPSYLVIVGDSTRDYRNAYGHVPRRQFVPTMMKDLTVNTQLGYYVSDTWLTAVGGTSLPSVLVGRLPARTLAEAEEMFRKVVAYETATHAPSWAGKAMLVSEVETGQPDFANAHDAIYGRYFTTGPQTALKVYEQDPSIVGCTTAATDIRSRIQNGVNAGAAILSFAGHGGYQNWGGGPLGCSFFETAASGDDVDPLTNGAMLQFQVHANCITGHFAQDTSVGASVDPWYTFLESWMTRAGKGAVAGLAPSHLSYNFMIDAVLDPVYGNVFGRRKERVIGALDLLVRQNLATLNDTVGVESYILEGDPATRLAVPAPDAPALTAVETASSGQLRVRWTAASGAASYRVYQSLSPGGPYTVAGTTTATSLLVSGLTNCSTYYFYVVAVDANGFESRWSNFNDTCFGDRSDCASGAPVNPVAPVAANVTGVADTSAIDGQLLVTWSLAGQQPDVLQYRVMWGTTAGGPYPNSKVVAALDPRVNTTESVVIGGLVPQTRYHVVARAETCSATGPTGAEGSAVVHQVLGTNPPDAIGDLRVQRVAGTNDLRLTWTLPATTVWGTTTTLAGVDVYGAPDTARFAIDVAHRLAALAGTATSWTHTGAAAGTGRWYYVIVARDGSGLTSAPGDQLPAGLDTLRVTRAGSNVTLSWSPLAKDVDGRPIAISGYNVYGRPSLLPRSACAVANRVATAVSGNSFAMPLPAGTFYTWHVLGEDSHGAESVW